MEGEGGEGEIKLNSVILGHPMKPKHLHNTARFTFTTEFVRL